MQEAERKEKEAAALQARRDEEREAEKHYKDDTKGLGEQKASRLQNSFHHFLLQPHPPPPNPRASSRIYSSGARTLLGVGWEGCSMGGRGWGTSA